MPNEEFQFAEFAKWDKARDKNINKNLRSAFGAEVDRLESEYIRDGRIVSRETIAFQIRDYMPWSVYELRI